MTIQNKIWSWQNYYVLLQKYMQRFSDQSIVQVVIGPDVALIRKPSFKKSIAAMTYGKGTRQLKRALIPGYGKKGTGWLTNPSKAAYNHVYKRTTVGLSDLTKPAKKQRSSSVKQSSASSLVKHPSSPKTKSTATKIEVGYKYLSSQELEAIISCPKGHVRCIDIQATGSRPEKGDEILQLAVVDGNGKKLFYDYVKPRVRKRWDKAMKVHGIRPSTVQNAKTLDELKPGILKALNGARFIIGYDVGLIVAMLTCVVKDSVVSEDDCLPKSPRYIDVMREFSDVYGGGNDGLSGKRNKNLWDAGEFFGTNSSKKYDALADARLVVRVMYRLLQDPAYTASVNARRTYDNHVIKNQRVNGADSSKTDGVIQCRTNENGYVIPEKQGNTTYGDGAVSSVVAYAGGCLLLLSPFIILLGIMYSLVSCITSP